MEYTTLGETGMSVSRLCLGCMGFGSSDWREWVLDESASLEVLEHAIDLGFTFFDTANMYSRGESERVLGTALAGHREASVIASKVFYPMRDDPASGGLSRKEIEQELAASLSRLDVDTIDLYQIHRWDPDTPIETTLRTLDDAIGRSDIRYIGASSMWAHQFARSLFASERLGLERFATMQNHYNLVYREEEREMLPLCAREGVAVMPWSPLARGYLTRPHDEVEGTRRGASEEHLYEHPYMDGGGPEVNERVRRLAEEYDASMAQIAIAWHLHNDLVDVPIVGATTPEQLDEAVAALDLDIAEGDIEYLEEPYVPVRVSGHT